MGAGRLPFWVILINKSAFSKKKKQPAREDRYRETGCGLPRQVLLYDGLAHDHVAHAEEERQQTETPPSPSWP